MTNYLKSLWNKYLALKWYWQLLLIIPFIIGIILYILSIFIPNNDGNKFQNSVEQHKEYVDKQIKQNIEADKELKKIDRKLKQKQKKLQQEIRDNEEKTAKLISRIDDATNNNNERELKSIISELNVASRRRHKS